MSKTYVVISDTQIPLDDRRKLKALINFIGDYKPDEVVHIGDLMDFSPQGRWSKGTAEEFLVNQLPSDLAAGRKRFLEPLRAVYDGPVGVIEGNHDERPRVYLSKYAPAVSGVNPYRFEQLLHFDDFGIGVLPEFYEFAPDWLMTHGHRGGIKMTQESGKTALNAAKRFNKSVIMGHTHRLGVMSHSYGFGGKVTKTLTGVEVGNLMDMRQAQYLKGATANWQQGFGIVTVDGTHVRADTIKVDQNRFVVDGVVYPV